MTSVRYQKYTMSLSKRERTIITALLGVVCLLLLLDVTEDWIEGVSIFHIFTELFMMIIIFGVSLYLSLQMVLLRESKVSAIQQEVIIARQQALVWQEHVQILKKGIYDAISNQFSEWGLTPAQKDIGFLLLKGLSLQEISGIRNTSERTIRQQCSEIYKKSRLSGRAQLAAFFLEDLFDTESETKST